MRPFLLPLVVLLVVTFDSVFPSIYLDNGVDTTAAVSRDDKKEIELEILSLLGLTSRPRGSSTSPLKKSAPRFLLDVYESLLLEEEEEEGGGRRRKRSSGVSFSGEERHRIDESDVIMTFESVNRHVATVRHERGKELWFNISDVPVAEDVVGAELRIYKNKRKSSLNPERKFTITVHQLIYNDEGKRQLEYVSSLNTTAKLSGWLSLNITACLASWVAFPDTNKGLYLAVHPLDKPGHEIKPEDLGLLITKAEDERQPFMVVFMKAVNHVRPRIARDIRSRKDTYTSMMSKFKDKIPMKGGDFEPHQRRSCHLENLYVSFKDLKWEDWIIAPEGYEAFYCAGECNFPLNSHMNATNHAIVQTLVNLMYPFKYPIPCCAPKKLSSISVLYYFDDENVILKKYKKMVVKSCGCH